MVKDNIQQYIAGITLEFDRCQDMSIYSAEQIAAVMKLKRNTVSGYLNQLAAEGSLVKINSRPVYFLERAALEQAAGRSGLRRQLLLAGGGEGLKVRGLRGAGCLFLADRLPRQPAPSHQPDENCREISPKRPSDPDSG